MGTIQTKRIYDEPAASDGFRVLVDRLWPRGISKERAALDLWLKEVAPSPELRMWFGHKSERFAAFGERYCTELARNTAVETLQQLVAGHERLTLLYGAKDPAVNHAVVLQQFLQIKC